MTDAFICEVIKKNAIDKTWDVQPKIVEFDGTDHKVITVNAVGGIDPQIGDIVLVVTARNNLDDKEINRFYESSETNGRIVAVAKPMIFYTFKGDFEFIGTVLFTGGIQTTGDLLVQGDLIVEKNASVGQNLIVTGSISAGSSITATGNISGLGDLTIAGEASVGSLVIGGAPYEAHTHQNNASSYPASAPTGPVI